MINEMLACNSLYKDNTCGGKDFSLSHRIDQINIYITVKCNKCQRENTYTVALRDSYSLMIPYHNETNKVEDV